GSGRWRGGAWIRGWTGPGIAVGRSHQQQDREKHQEPEKPPEGGQRYQTLVGYTGGQGIDQAEVGSGKRHFGSRTPRRRRFKTRFSPGLSNVPSHRASVPRSASINVRSTSPQTSWGSSRPAKSQSTVPRF